ncbi:hypothetical protein AVEN_270753-1, partial [Araneus ventricosus]
NRDERSVEKTLLEIETKREIWQRWEYSNIAKVSTTSRIEMKEVLRRYYWKSKQKEKSGSGGIRAHASEDTLSLDFYDTLPLFDAVEYSNIAKVSTTSRIEMKEVLRRH